MSEYKIIDAHTHIFPQKISQKAVDSIGKFYGLSMSYNGLADTLIKSGETIGVSKYLVCSTATKPEQVESINDFIYEECKLHSEFVGFATLHPDFDDVDAEFERILKRGYKGIKLHPDFQEFNIDDEKAFKIYERAQKAGLFILFHTGDNRYDFSAPKRLANVCEKFPDLKCIAAHFGGYRRWDEAYEYYKDYENIYMDTSSSLFMLKKDKVFKFFERYGIERFFFGTDFPMWTHKEEYDNIISLGLSREDTQKIFYDNFENAVLK